MMDGGEGDKIGFYTLANDGARVVSWRRSSLAAEHVIKTLVFE